VDRIDLVVVDGAVGDHRPRAGLGAGGGLPGRAYRFLLGGGVNVFGRVRTVRIRQHAADARAELGGRGRVAGDASGGRRWSWWRRYDVRLNGGVGGRGAERRDEQGQDSDEGGGSPVMAHRPVASPDGLVVHGNGIVLRAGSSQSLVHVEPPKTLSPKSRLISTMRANHHKLQ
jgi:hypothetical protein